MKILKRDFYENSCGKEYKQYLKVLKARSFLCIDFTNVLKVFHFCFGIEHQHLMLQLIEVPFTERWGLWWQHHLVR